MFCGALASDSPSAGDVGPAQGHSFVHACYPPHQLITIGLWWPWGKANVQLRARRDVSITFSLDDGGNVVRARHVASPLASTLAASWWRHRHRVEQDGRLLLRSSLLSLDAGSSSSPTMKEERLSLQGGGAGIRRVWRFLRWYMDDRTRHNTVGITAWLESVRQASVDETSLIKTQTAVEAESGVDISRLRANLRLTPEERLARMVAADNFFASIRGTVRRRHAL